jgi:capsular exopolysaccharide synthesis family protein
MSRLFEALSDVELYKPSPKIVPPVAAPNDVIQLTVRTVDATPPSAVEELETEQHAPEAAPVEVNLSDAATLLSEESAETQQHAAEPVRVKVLLSDGTLPVPAKESGTAEHVAEAAVEASLSHVTSLLSAKESETEQHVVEVEASACDATPAISVEALETEQPAAEPVAVEVSASDATPATSVEGLERERHTVELVAVEVSACDATPALAAEGLETEQHMAEPVAVEVSACDATPTIAVEELETEQPAAEPIPVGVSACDATPAIAVEASETEQHTAEPVAVEVPPSDVVRPMSAEESQAARHLPEVATEVPLTDVTLPFSAQEVRQQPAEVTRREASLSTMKPSSARGTTVAKDSKLKPIEFGPVLPVNVSVPPESRLVALTEPNSLGAEKFRALVTRLEHMQKEHELKCFQVTSSVIHEGKTLVSGNVAITLAKYSGSKTLLIEGDLHRPTLATLFGLANLRGLSHWWYRQDQDIAQFVYRLGDLPLWFLPAGQPYDRPSDILRSARFVKAFSQLSSRFEWIVVDSTPMLPIVDVNLWSRLVDGTLLVVREGVTPVKALKQGLVALDHPKIIGVVLNDASATNEAKYDDQYYSSKKRQPRQGVR